MVDDEPPQTGPAGVIEFQLVQRTTSPPGWSCRCPRLVPGKVVFESQVPLGTVDDQIFQNGHTGGPVGPFWTAS